MRPVDTLVVSSGVIIHKIAIRPVQDLMVKLNTGIAAVQALSCQTTCR